MRVLAQAAILAAAFAAGTGLALLAGAALGPATAFGQIAFAVALVAILLRT